MNQSQIIKKLEEAPLDYCGELFGCSLEEAIAEATDINFGGKRESADIKNLFTKIKNLQCLQQKER